MSITMCETSVKTGVLMNMLSIL